MVVIKDWFLDWNGRYAGFDCMLCAVFIYVCIYMSQFLYG